MTDLHRQESSIIELENTFNCSICLNELNSTFITRKCAHRFCEDCIKKSVEQFHKCPLCNTDLTYADLLKDNLFDNLKNDLKVFQQKKMHAVLNKLIEATGHAKIEHNFAEFSPLENVLKNHLIKTLQTHENYIQKLKINYEKEIERINLKCQEQIVRIETVFTNKHEIEKEKNAILEKAKKDKEELASDLGRQINSIAKKYEKYLEQSEMTPLALPSKIRIKLMDQKKQFDGLVLKPNDEISVVYDFLVRETEKRNNKIVEFSNDVIILCFGAFSKYTFQDAQDIFDKYIDSSVLPDDIELINPKKCFPILEHSIKPNSELAFFGKIKFESDLPKRCFKTAYNKANPKPCDYFKCVTCGLNWICKSCMQTCHINHEIKEFSLNHNPNWACCYCDRKDCKLNSTY